MANILLGNDPDSDYTELMGGKKKKKKKSLKARLKAKKQKVLKKVTGKKSLTPAQKKKLATIMALPLPPLTKKLMMAKVIKGKAKPGTKKKAKKAGRKIGTTAAAFATGGIAALVAKRAKKRKAKKRAAAARKTEEKKRIVSMELPETVQQQTSSESITSIAPDIENEEMERPEVVENAKQEIVEAVQEETGKQKNLMIPLLAAAGVGALLLMNKK